MKELDTSQFDSYIRQLSKKLDVDLPTVVNSEAASVMKIASASHRPSKAAKVKADTRFAAMSNISTGLGKISVNKKSDRGRVWFTNGNGQWKPIGQWDGKKANYDKSIWRLSKGDWKASRKLWNEGKRGAKTAIDKALKSRGLAGQSWLKIIRKLGFSYETISPLSTRVPAVTPNAIARTGRIYLNEFVNKVKMGSNYLLTVINKSPLTIKNKGRMKLKSAMAKRKAFFKRNLKNGAFDSAKEAAAKYPGVKVR